MNAMRPAELGTVRLMNLTAEARAMQGKRGSGVSTAPRSEIADARNVSWREEKPRDHPRQVRVTECVRNRAEADLGELRDEQVRGEPDRHGRQDVLGADAPKRHRLRHLDARCGGGLLAKLLQREVLASVRGLGGAA